MKKDVSTFAKGNKLSEKAYAQIVDSPASKKAVEIVKRVIEAVKSRKKK